MLFLQNPARRGRRTRKRKTTKAKGKAGSRSRRKPPKGFRTWKAYMASIRPSRGKTKRRRKASGGGSMARRRRKRTTARRATTRRRPARRRRTYRRNPPRRPRLTGKITKGVIGAGQVLAGEAAAGTVARLIAPTGATNIVVKGGVAFLVGFMGQRFFGADAAEKLMIGALLSAARPIVVAANIPFISDAIAGDGAALPDVASYPQLNSGRLASYPQADYDVSLATGDDMQYYQ